MTATAITVNQLSRAGSVQVAATAGDNVNGNSVANDGKVFFLLTNADGANPHTLTVTPAVTGPDGLSIGTKTVTVPASGSYITDTWPTATYGTSLALTVDSAQLKIAPYRHT
jgi:hypothetical protein